MHKIRFHVTYTYIYKYILARLVTIAGARMKGSGFDSHRMHKNIQTPSPLSTNLEAQLMV